MPTDPRQMRILADSTAAPIIASGLNRRRFLGLAGVVGASAALAACSPSGSGSTSPSASGGPLEESLSLYSWGEYDPPEVIEAFTANVGPNVRIDSYGSNEEMIAKLVAARGTSGYDIVVPTGIFIPQMIENGLLQRFNKDLLPNLSNVDPEFLAQDWDPENEYSVCKAWGTTGFVYDTTAITRDLVTWNDFIDAAQNEASGRMSVLDDPIELVGIYYWANGIDYRTTETADIDAAEEFVVNELAPHIAAFDSYPGSTAIPQGSQMLMQSWNGDARLGILNSESPDRWKWVLGSPSTELWMDNWAIAVGAPNPEAAHAFIDNALAPDNAISYLDYVGYNTGAAGVEQTAADAGLERTDMIFFTPEQLETMNNGAVNEAQERNVDIWNKAKAAAGA